MGTFLRSLPLLEHSGTGKFTITNYDARRFYEVVKKSDNSRVALPDANGVITMPSYGEFYLYSRTSEGERLRSKTEFWRKAWGFTTYSYGGDQCNCVPINPCNCQTPGCCNECQGDCYNCCGNQCGQCTGYNPRNESAPYEYGPGNNTYPYSGGEWFYIGEVEKP